MTRRFAVYRDAGWPACVLGLLGILLTNTFWEFLDASPASWDMAYHQLQGWHLLEAARQGHLWGNLATLSPAYPPLYYLQEAWLLSLFGDTQFLALLANLPGLVMLVGATYFLLRDAIQPAWLAGAAACLPLLLPFTAWVEREALLDIGLAGFVSVAVLLIRSSHGFTRLFPTLLFGLACLGGVLTKWTLPLYLVGPMAFGLFYLSRDRLLALRNLCLAGLLVVPVSLLYFAPLLSDLASRYPTTEQSGLIPWQPYPRHGEPGLNNIWGWVYYPRVMVSYFLQFPLLVFLVVPLRDRVHKTRDAPSLQEGSRRVVGLCWWWLLSGVFLLIFLTPKDPRFFLPLICPMSVLLVWRWRSRSRGLKLLLAVAALQFLLVSFGTPLGPIRWASWVWDNEADYQSLQHEWVWFQTFYFNASGPPDPSDWSHQEILQQIEAGSVVGFVPEVAHFNPDGFLLESVRRKVPLRVSRLGNARDWEAQLGGIDYLIGKTEHQGISFITEFSGLIMARVEAEWKLAGEWGLPDGSRAQLWKRT